MGPMSAPEQGPAPNELVKALAHPTRRRILRLFLSRKDPVSPSDAARTFGVKVAQLSYHFRCLKTAGVITIVDEEPAGRGLVRHCYRLAPGVPELEMVRSTLESTDGQRQGAG
jgi:DNA-binding transcriptional ArsR family regulator